MSEEREIEKKLKIQRETYADKDIERLKNEQERQRGEVGSKIVAEVIEIIYNRYPEMKGVEPIIRDEDISGVAENILSRLKEFKTKESEVDDMEKAWKSFLFEKEIIIDKITMARIVNAVINRRGDIARIDESMG